MTIKLSDELILKIWKQLGGKIHYRDQGNISMPEEKFYGFIRQLVAAITPDESGMRAALEKLVAETVNHYGRHICPGCFRAPDEHRSDCYIQAALSKLDVQPWPGMVTHEPTPADGANAISLLRELRAWANYHKSPPHAGSNTREAWPEILLAYLNGERPPQVMEAVNFYKAPPSFLPLAVEIGDEKIQEAWSAELRQSGYGPSDRIVAQVHYRNMFFRALRRLGYK